jgi:hypothetical protein
VAADIPFLKMKLEEAQKYGAEQLQKVASEWGRAEHFRTMYYELERRYNLDMFQKDTELCTVRHENETLNKTERAAVQRKEMQIRDLEQRVKVIVAENADMRRQRDAAKGSSEKMKAENTRLDQVVQKLDSLKKEEANKAREQLAEAKTKVHEKKAELKKIKDELEKTKAESENGKKAAFLEANKKLQETKAELNKTKEALEKTKKELESTINALSARVSAAVQKVEKESADAKHKKKHGEKKKSEKD